MNVKAMKTSWSYHESTCGRTLSGIQKRVFLRHGRRQHCRIGTEARSACFCAQPRAQ